MENILDEIKLQELTSKDIKPFFELMNNNRHLLERYFPVTVDNTRTLLGTEYYVLGLLKKRDNNEMICLTVMHKNKMVGLFHIKSIDWRIPKCELAYFMDHTYQGKGIMTSLLQKVVEYCFNVLQMNKIFVRITQDNSASRKVAAKIGFQTEGILKKEFRTESGELLDLEYLGLVNPTIR